MDRNKLNDRLPQVVDALVKSVHEHEKLQHLNRVHLPDREKIIAAVKLLRKLVFPGYFGAQGLTTANLPFRLGEIVLELTDLLSVLNMGIGMVVVVPRSRADEAVVRTKGLVDASVIGEVVAEPGVTFGSRRN